MQEVVVCPSCGIRLGIPETTAGQLIQCSSCQTLFSSLPNDEWETSGPAPRDYGTAGDDGAAWEGRNAGAEGRSNVLAWVMTYVVVMALAGSGGFLTWHLTHGPATEEGMPVLELKKSLPDVGSKDEPMALTGKKDGPAVEFNQSEPKPLAPRKEEPKKEVPEPPKPNVLKITEQKKQQPAEVEATQAEPPKDEIMIGEDGWFEVHCLRGKFHVALPAIPVFQLMENAPGNDAGPEYTAKHPRADLVFRAGARQLQGEDAAVSPAAHLRSVVKRLFPETQFELKTEKDIVHDGRRGQEFLAVGFNNVKVAGRYFRLDGASGKTHVFYFTAAGPGASLSAPDVRRFFQSVKFDKSEILVKEKENPPPGKARDIPEAKGTTTQAKKEPDPKGPDQNPPDTNVSDLKKPEGPNRARPRMAGEVSTIAGRLKPHLGAIIDLEAKAALLILPGGQARLFDYPDFKPLGVYKLGAGTAYQPLFDKASGRLFALSPNAKAKDPAGKFGGSQVVQYDIRGLLNGRFNPNAEVAPARIIQLGGFCSHLCLSPDGAWLYALESVNPRAIKVVRVNVATGMIDGTVLMPEFTEKLSLARDGKVLYALSHLTPRTPKGPPPQGAILVVDPGTMKLKRTIAIPVDPFAMEVTKGGIVFVSVHGGVRGEIIVVDAGNASPVVAMWKGVTPDSSLKLSDDERSLFVGKWKESPAMVAALAIPDVLAGSDLPMAEWAQHPLLPVRGDMVITPDNQYLLCDSGVAFFLK